jgi:hypothetical protein
VLVRYRVVEERETHLLNLIKNFYTLIVLLPLAGLCLHSFAQDSVPQNVIRSEETIAVDNNNDSQVSLSLPADQQAIKPGVVNNIKPADLIKPNQLAANEVRHEDSATFVATAENATPLSERIEDLKNAALELNRDLLILEEDLLFPANTQVAIFVSVDIGNFFTLDGIRLMIDGEMVASHLYTEKQNSALMRGGVQRLYLGNLKTGSHQISAFFHGYGPANREYKRGATYTLKKDQTPTMLEIRIQDWINRQQPTFEFKEWHP